MTLKINRNFALLYGIMLGDGCLSSFNKRKYLVIAGSMADDKPFFENIIKPIISSLVNKNPPIIYRPSKGAIYLNFVNKALFDFIADFGFPVGKKGDRLFIPEILYKKNLVKYLVKGFFATDGSLVLTDNCGVLYPRVEANGVAIRLIKEIGAFLNSKDINCNVYEAKRIKQSGFVNRNTQYRLQINGRKNLNKFVKTIGFINPKQIEKLNRYYGCTES